MHSNLKIINKQLESRIAVVAVCCFLTFWLNSALKMSETTNLSIPKCMSTGLSQVYEPFLEGGKLSITLLCPSS